MNTGTISRMTHAHALLQSLFGYDDFRGLQQPVIDTVIAGNNALVLMPTGAGKSLCYQIPALVRDGVGIVISPLIALMQDQVSALTQLGVRAAYLNSTLGAQEAFSIEQALRHNQLDLLYIAPERLLTDRCLAMLHDCVQHLALFAIDEAHCASQWGHDFRPEYQRLGVLAEQFPSVPRMALTATADEPTRRDMIQLLQLEQAEQFISGFDRPNIRYHIGEKHNPRQQLLQFIKQHHQHDAQTDAGIVYCLSRKKVDATAEFLQQQGLNALPYHAGLSAEVRQRHQQQFINEEGVIVVATIAFGMGIDKPNVRFVAHLDLPKSLEAYYQETGRAGRDGLPAQAWMVYGLQDVIQLKQMLDNSNASDEQKRIERHKLDAMLGLCETIECRRIHLLKYFGDELPQPCNNCDNCLNPPQTWDATVNAQKALSAVYRTGQRYGVGYLIKVLRGDEHDDVLHRGHHRLGVFGLGSDLDTNQWNGIFRQLIARGLLRVDLSQWGQVCLTELARPVLRGEQTLYLRKTIKPSRHKSERISKRSSVSAKDELLWNALRDCRVRIAKEQKVPPYVIFHDATLMQMVSEKPNDREQLSRLSGVGERKLYAYGNQFLDVIREHQTEQDYEKIPSHDITCRAFLQGKTPEVIASERGINEQTVYRHLAKSIAQKQLNLRQVIDINDDDLNTIDAAIAITQGEPQPLKTLFDHLDGAFDYSVLVCVLAARRPENAA